MVKERGLRGRVKGKIWEGTEKSKLGLYFSMHVYQDECILIYHRHILIIKNKNSLSRNASNTPHQLHVLAEPPSGVSVSSVSP